jgi:hypothetical protein
MSDEPETTKRMAARFPCCLIRLVRRAGPNVCWVMMMVFILTANSRAAGVDALLVAILSVRQKCFFYEAHVALRVLLHDAGNGNNSFVKLLAPLCGWPHFVVLPSIAP